VPSSWDLVAATSALSNSGCTVVSFMFARQDQSPARKISLSNVNREFNNSVHVDILYLDGVDRRPIIHAVDTRTSFSMARLCQNRDLELLASTFERQWVHVHGAPAEVSGDQEFAQGYFQDMLRRHDIAFREQGARRHNKTGVVERGNGF
jgi:hypothetical protein